MSLAVWILIGVIAGFIAGRLANHSVESTGFDIFIGIAGALMGGLMMTFVGLAGAKGLGVWCILVSVISAIVLLIGFNAVTSNERTLAR